MVFFNFLQLQEFKIINILAIGLNHFFPAMWRHSHIVPDMLHPNLYRHIVSYEQEKTLWLRGVILFEIQEKLIIWCIWIFILIIYWIRAEDREEIKRQSLSNYTGMSIILYRPRVGVTRLAAFLCYLLVTII